MEKGIMEYKISIFGNFSYIYSNINVIGQIFSDCNKQISTDAILNGIAVNCYHLVNKDMAISIRNDRIDFEALNGNKNLLIFSNAFDKIKDYLKYGLNRIAINYNSFYVDSSGELLKRLSIKTLFEDCNGKLSEINIRKNYITKFRDEYFNNIVTIQNASLQKNDSFESFNAIVFMVDVNSVVLNELNHQSFTDFFKDYCEFLMNRGNEILSNYEGVLEGE